MRNQTRRRGDLYDQATAFIHALDAANGPAVDQMLAAWSDAYWAIRQDLDTLAAQIDMARTEGQVVNRSWLNQQNRLRNVLVTARRELLRYAHHTAGATTAAQRRALAAARTSSAHLLREAVPPGVVVDLADVNPDNLRHLVGFLSDGSVLADHLARTIPGDAVTALRDTLVKGFTLGWGQDRMVKAFTETLAVAHTRAVTILRTESLRVYRETSRATFAANPQVCRSWVWTSALDRRSCPACVVMHGTEHPVTETLDGHPRCRCCMVPRTHSWADLGLDPALDDLRPPLPDGKAWLEAQSSRVQRGILGPGKYRAWRDGTITLDDMVARRMDDRWGSMRTERSLKSIREGRNANWFDPV